MPSRLNMKEIKFVICVDNSEYPTSLERRKIYEALPDSEAESVGQLRIVDESGEDYLYPAEYFIDANLTDETRDALVNAA